MKSRPAFTFMLLALLATLMAVHLQYLMHKQTICERYAIEVLKGLNDDPQPYRKEFSRTCDEVTHDFESATETYLACLISLLSGVAIGSRD